MTDDPRPPVVLGREFAAAQERDQERSRAHPGPSPLQHLRYERRLGHISAPNFARDPLDDALLDLVEKWMDNPEGLADLREKLSLNDLYTLLTFAHRTTVLGLRSRDPTWARGALAALAQVEPERVDHRDLRWAAGLVAYTLERLTGDAGEEIRRAAVGAGESTRTILERLAEYPPRTLHEWGYAVVGDHEETALVGHEGKPWNPTIDLVQIARRIAAAIDDDGTYEASDVNVATGLGEVWVRGGPEEEPATTALAEAMAIASVRAYSADDQEPAGPTFGSQMFMVYVVENIDSDAAQLVCRAVAESTGRFARLAVCRDSLAAIVIARSVVKDVSDRESNASLIRFKESIADALEQ